MIASRLALFLQAGLSPQASWRELSREIVEGPCATAVAEVADALARGERHRDAVSGAAAEASWKQLSAVVDMADMSGSPLAQTLGTFAAAMTEHSRVEREIRAMMTAPRLTVWLLVGLPPLGLVVASALGADPLGVLVGSGFGRLMLVSGVVMVGVALWWMRRLVEGATPPDDHAGVERELFAIAVSSGALPELALTRVGQVMDRHELPRSPSRPLEQLATLSRRAGVPVASLARAESQWFMDRRRIEANERIAELSVRVLIPVGLLVLPAFVVLAIVPVVVSLLGQAVSVSTVPW